MALIQLAATLITPFFAEQLLSRSGRFPGKSVATTSDAPRLQSTTAACAAQSQLTARCYIKKIQLYLHT
jgi:hypothetical protein